MVCLSSMSRKRNLARRALAAAGREAYPVAMTNSSEWEGRVGHAWAAEWQRTDRSFAGLTARLLARIAEVPAREVLDLGCGAGELALAVAKARPEAQVTGLDLSAELVEAARVRGAGCANLSFVHGDASRWRPDAAPDLVISRHGVMFFPDPHQAFAHIAQIAAPGARLMFSCFRTARENEWARAVLPLSVAPPPPGDAPQGYQPGPFGFGDPALVRDILSQTGWTDIALEPVDYDYLAGEGPEAPDDAFAFLRRIGPAAGAMFNLPPEEREAGEQRLRAVLEARFDGQRIAWPAAAWIATARAPQSPMA